MSKKTITQIFSKRKSMLVLVALALLFITVNSIALADYTGTSTSQIIFDPTNAVAIADGYQIEDKIHKIDANLPTEVQLANEKRFRSILRAPLLDGGGNADTIAGAGCMQDIYDDFGQGGSLNCTANDVSLAAATNITILDNGCAFPGDTVTFTADFEVKVTASSRYDVGIYFAEDGDPNADGAYSGTCSISTPAYAPTPAWLDLDGTGDNTKSSNDFGYCSTDGGTTMVTPNIPCDGGSAAAGDAQCVAEIGAGATCEEFGTGITSPIQDTCGDISKPSFSPIYPTITQTVTCLDDDGDGELDLPYCTSWRQSGANELCTTPLAAYPGSPSKCNCDPGFGVPILVPGRINTVDKVTLDANGNPLPGDPTLFNFTLTGPDIDLPANFQLKDADTPYQSPGLSAGTGYNLTETTLPNWTQVSAECTSDQNTTVNLVATAGVLGINNGESFSCTFTNRQKADRGDLPSEYGTLLADNGPSHVLPTSGTAVWLGAVIDIEDDGQPGTGANGDNGDSSDDEDGVTFPTNSEINTWENGQTKTITVIANSDAATQAEIGLWIDWTNDGDFNDANEFYSTPVAVAVDGVTNVPFDVTMTDYTAGDPIYVRTRIFSASSRINRAVVVADALGVAVNGEVEDYLMGSSSLPVTLSYFHAMREDGSVSFDWQTASETGNMGFNLYTQTKNGLQQINEQLILSTEMSSMRASDYSFNAEAGIGDVFFIEDVDIFGKTKRRGPFTLGQAYGRKTAEIPIDWTTINAEHVAKAVERHAAASRDAQTRVQQADIASSGPLLNLGVSQNGLYRLTHTDLLSAGLDLTGVNLANIAVVQGVTPLPITVSGSGSVFDTNSYIEFYGQAIDTLYSKENIYTLHIDAALAARAVEDNSTAVGAPAVSYQESISLGDENKYDVASHGDSPWYDSRLTAYNNPASKSFTITVDNYVAGAAPVDLTAKLLGLTIRPEFPDHHAILKLGTTAVADVTFDGLSTHTVDVVLAEGLLQEGANTLHITLPDDTGALWDVVGVDSYGVTYPRSFVAKADGQLTFNANGTAFQVDNLPSADVVAYRSDVDGSLTQLTNVAVSGSGGSYSASFTGSGVEATYLVYSSENLLSPTLQATRPYTDITSGTADYLMISHADFIDGLAPLVAFHAGNGLSVKVVDVADVYAQFSDGIFDPQAIKDYIQNAANNMDIEYVLLVGGDTYDYADNLDLGSISFIPSPYMSTGPIIAFAPVDPLYADVDGDLAPDLKLGRFPVRTSAELADMINKTLLYATADYKDTAVFAADVLSERSYTSISTGFADGLPANWQTETAYLDEMTVADARSTLIDSINAGVGFTSFVGHSGPNQWTWLGLFDADDAGALTNVGQPTAVAQWGCWNTYHVSPYYNTLGHQFMQGDSGAAIVLGAATLTSADSENLLGQAFMSKFSAGNMTFGTALQSAKAEVEASSPGLLDVQLGYSLMGDPALSMVEHSPTAVSINFNRSPIATNMNIAWILAAALLSLTVFIIYLRRYQTK